MEIDVEGHRAYAATGGRAPDASLPTSVFVHGSGMDHTVWSLQLRYFAHHGRNAWAIDLPGHGRSAGDPRRSIEGYRDWLLRFLDAAGIATAALIGHSMGALIALALAATAPDRVRALGLLGVSARMSVHPELLRAAAAGERVAIELVASWGFGRAAHLGGAQSPGMWMLGAAMRLMERDRRQALAADLAACDAYRAASAAAKLVRCRTLILAGDGDRMTPAKSGRELASLIDGAAVAVLPGCGHMMMIERPDATLDALTEIA